MKIVTDPASVIRNKIALYKEEFIALKDACWWYRIVFALLLVILFIPLLIELLMVKSLHRDPGLFEVQSEQQNSSVLIEANVPDKLKPLIPLAEQFGHGEAELRDRAIASASKAELDALEQQVAAYDQQITNWLNQFEESELNSTTGYFIYMLLAAEEAAARHDQ